jgi:ribosomal protein L40E
MQPDETGASVRQEKHPIAEAVSECYRCGATIGEGQEHCPQCGRPLYRVCYCGWRIPINAHRCPQCDADWSGAMRVRKKAHSHRVNPRRLGSYAVLGALAALALTALGGLLLGKLAERALPEGQPMPHALGERMALAWEGVEEVLSTIGRRLAALSGGLGLVLLILLMGAAVGALIYLAHEGLLRFTWPRAHRKGKVRRRRRVR